MVSKELKHEEKFWKKIVKIRKISLQLLLPNCSTDIILLLVYPIFHGKGAQQGYAIPR